MRGFVGGLKRKQRLLEREHSDLSGSKKEMMAVIYSIVNGSLQRREIGLLRRSSRASFPYRLDPKST
jgi:hypothetical protein